MLPTIQDGDLLTIEEVPVTQLQRGDLIVFKIDEKRQYLKRLIGLPGETVKIRDGEVYINDQALEEPYVQQRATSNAPAITLKSDEYYVLGDNRPNSSDSRAFGPVRGTNILGRVKQ